MLLPELEPYLNRFGGLAFPVAQVGEPLPALLSGLGIERRTGGDYDWHGLRRMGGGNVIFQYTLGGRGRLSYGRTQHRLEPGEGLVVYVPSDHRYWLEPDEEWTFFWINCRGSWLNQVWLQAADTLRGKVIAAPDTPLVQCAVEILQRHFQRDLKDRWIASDLAYGLTIRLMEHVFPAEQPGSTHGESQLSAEIGAVVEFVRENLERNIGVEEMAAAAGMSRYHFSRKFAGELGVPPGEYLINERLQRALRLLQSRRNTVKTVAHACGFTDPNYFSRAFRKRYGLSPVEYRAGQLYGR